MSEYIVRETGSPGAVKQETIGELVRCEYCKHNLHPGKPNTVCGLNIPIFDGNGYCSEGERKDDE